MSGRILIAGIGNVFLGDDGFGVEVVRRLRERPLPASVRVGDFGIRGFDLAYALLDDYDAAVLVDVTRRGGAPGTLYVLDLQAPQAPTAETVTLTTHGMDPVRALELARALGEGPRTLRLVGCEPQSLAAAGDVDVGLSPSVAAAVEPAVELISSLVAELARGHAGA